MKLVLRSALFALSTILASSSLLAATPAYSLRVFSRGLVATPGSTVATPQMPTTPAPSDPTPAPVTPPVPTDPYFSSVTLLLHLDDLNDSSALQHALTVAAGPTITNSNKVFGSGSLLLNRTGSVAQGASADYSFGTGDFTVEFWLNTPIDWPTQPASAGIIGMKASDTTNGWVIYRDTAVARASKVNARVGGTNNCTSGSTPTTGVWEHWALVRQGTTLRWFRNGAVDATCTSTANIIDTAPLYMGYTQTWGGRSNVYLDDVRITKGVARYIGTFTPPTQTFLDQ